MAYLKTANCGDFDDEELVEENGIVIWKKEGRQ